MKELYKKIAVTCITLLVGFVLVTSFLGHNYGFKKNPTDEGGLANTIEMQSETIIKADCGDGQATVDIQQLGYNDYAVIEVVRNGERLRQPIASTTKQLPNGQTAELQPLQIYGDSVKVTLVDGSLLSNYTTLDGFPAETSSTVVSCDL